MTTRFTVHPRRARLPLPATDAPAAELAHTGASQGELAGAAVLIAAAGTALTVTAARRRRGGDAA